MSIPGAGNPLLLGGAGGYKIERSIRLNASDSAYFSRTPASAGNRKTFTISLWVKRCKLGVLQSFISSANDTVFLFDSSDKLCLYLGGGFVRVSTQVFRDVSAWYHLVLVVDTPNATAQNRVRMYVNNSEITAWDTNGTVTQNLDTTWNAALAHQIGANNTSQFPDQYIADFHNIDGQALTPSSFGETDINGVWQPKAFSGSYGTNGFKLAFADNSAATATTLGKDTSGNANNWTPNNLSVSAGAGNDSLVDTPTSYGTDDGLGGSVRGNYATWNPLSTPLSATISNGNLSYAVAVNNGTEAVFSTIAISSGKWYVEYTETGTYGRYNFPGVQRINGSISRVAAGFSADSWSFYSITGNKYNNSTASSYATASTANGVIGVALDLDNGTLTFYRDGVSLGAAFTGLPAGTYAFSGGAGITVGTLSFDVNFGQRPFAYTAPSGFKALCTENLPAPTITKPSSVMDVKLYTGNGSTQTISGLGFSPDLVWIKARSQAYAHRVYDQIRGTTKALYTSTADAEGAYQSTYENLTSFNSDGFSVGTASITNTINENAATFVAWTWDAGSTTVTNTDGTISSQVRANASAGFSVVTWTGDGAASASVGHGLGVAPRLYLTKCRDSIGGALDNWGAFTTATGSMLYGFLNTTAAFGTPSQSAPTSTTINVVSLFENVSGKRFVAYCFAPVAGYSAFGSYTGNGSADGPFVYTGFRPRWVMIKCSSTAASWITMDSARATNNGVGPYLFPNLSDAENSTGTVSDLLDLNSNGFKLRGNYATTNSNAATYVYAAFAEAPFALARAR